MTRRWRLVLMLAVTALALAGCGDGADGAGAGNGGTDGTPGATGPAPVSPLDFTATTIDGKPFDGRALAGRPAALWFWAPWCPTCLGQAPGVRTAAERHGDDVAIVGVAGLDSPEAMPAFVRQGKVEAIPHVVDETGKIWQRFGVTAQSTFVLLDPAGEIVFQGKLGADEIPDRIAALADQAS